ncbi:MAG: hypothetical protein HKN41_01610, partial [Ilumatobacter sp.]|nr:hypothetical protein [Ilumatobacter sp.]
PVRGLYRATGSSMEEGFMLVFPKLVQQGKAPNEDFLHLYGPASLDVLALWYRLVGDTLESQRTFGLLQHVGIILALYTLARAWGHVAAVGTAGVATLMIITPIGLSALAWHGALALGLWAVVFGVRALATESGRDLWWAGGLAGLALGYRPDLVVALAVALGYVLWRRRDAGWKFMVGGAVVGLLPMWYHLARVGLPTAVEGMVIEPIVDLRPGRELPRPPSWNVADGALQAVAEGVPPWWGPPALGHSQQLFLWFFAVIAIAVAVPLAAILVRRRHDDDTALADVLVVAGLFGLGILPQALQRPDSTHLAWVSVVSWSLLVPAIVLVVGDRRPALRSALSATAAVALLMLIVCPFYTYRHYVLHTRVSAEQLPLPFLVERDDHRFWFGDFFVAEALNEMIPDLDARSEPGDRLIVGPADLSRTIYSDVSVYFLFPELEPATYYIEMDPGLADVEGSGLAEDVERADFLVLTNIWTGWNEPNASDLHRSEEHNQAVADHHCLVGQYQGNLVLLFERCEGGGGVDPSTVPGPFPVVANDDA